MCGTPAPTSEKSMEHLNAKNAQLRILGAAMPEGRVLISPRCIKRRTPGRLPSFPKTSYPWTVLYLYFLFCFFPYLVSCPVFDRSSTFVSAFLKNNPLIYNWHCHSATMCKYLHTTYKCGFEYTQHTDTVQMSTCKNAKDTDQDCDMTTENMEYRTVDWLCPTCHHQFSTGAKQFR